MQLRWPVTHDVVMYRHSMYHIKLWALFSVVITLLKATTFKYIISVIVQICVTMFSYACAKIESIGYYMAIICMPFSVMSGTFNKNYLVPGSRNNRQFQKLYIYYCQLCEFCSVLMSDSVAITYRCRALTQLTKFNVNCFCVCCFCNNEFNQIS